MKLAKLTLQIKPVGNNCNLHCEYCYAMPFRCENFKILDLEVVEKIVKEAFEVTDNLIITWHGGEPTMPGVKYYKDYMAIVEKYKAPHQNVVNMIQTNATLITDEFAQFFVDNDFIVSVSIDGDAETHNRNRHYASGKESYDKTMEGVTLLRKYGIYPPVIATVSKNTYEDCERTFKSFISEGFTEIKFSPVYDSAEDEFSISSDEWLTYIKRVMDLWMEMQDPSIKVREIDEVLEWFSGGQINTCSSTNSCINWMSIDEEGNVYPCEYLRATESYGNVKEMHIADVFNTEAHKRFVAKVMHIPDECKACEFYSMCGNGCPATRVRNNELVYNGVYVYCEERKGLYGYISEILLGDE